MAVRSEVRLTETKAANGPAQDADTSEAPDAPEGTGSVPAGPLPEGSLPEALRDALVAPPVWEKQVLEIGVRWPGVGAVPAGQEWAAERFRVFLLTWDPFEWIPERPTAFATSTSRGAGAGLVLYLSHWQALAMAGGQPEGLAGVLGRLGQSVLSVATEHRDAITDGSYPAGVQAGSLARLLSRVPAEVTVATPTLSLVEGWQPIQFNVLEDLAQDGFGPADLDRGPVRFAEPGEGRPGCPGCAGDAVDFPDGLKDAQEAICGPHRAEALQLTTARLEASKASNPAGWEALIDAGQRLGEPHLPNGLGPRLVAAAHVHAPTAAQLVDYAAMVVGAAGLMTGLPDPETALGGRILPVRPWLEAFPGVLDDEGLTDEAAQVSEAAAELLSSASDAAAAAAAAAAAEEMAAAKPKPYVREVRVGRNAPCPCGSGKKYKFCHGTGH